MGLQQISDYGNPQVLNGVAREAISGGQIVGVSGANSAVTSGTDSYVTSDIQFVVATSAANAVGVALGKAESGAALAVAVNGVFILPCAGSVNAGGVVKFSTSDAVANLGSYVVPASAEDSAAAGGIFGKAYTQGTSGAFAIISLGL